MNKETVKRAEAAVRRNIAKGQLRATSDSVPPVGFEPTPRRRSAIYGVSDLTPKLVIMALTCGFAVSGCRRQQPVASGFVRDVLGKSAKRAWSADGASRGSLCGTLPPRWCSTQV